MKKYLVTWGNLNFSKRTEKCMYYSNTQYNRRYIKTLSLMLFITTEIIKCDKKYKIIKNQKNLENIKNTIRKRVKTETNHNKNIATNTKYIPKCHVKYSFLLIICKNVL